MKQLVFVVFFSILCINGFGQTDTEFWFVAPEATAQHGDQPIYLRVAGTGTSGNVTISQPADPTFPVITQGVTATGVTSINLTPYLSKIETKPGNLVLSTGLFIQATVDITAYYEIANTFNPEIFPLKGKNALGTEFYVPAQNLYNNQVGSAAFDIVATENNTTITITPSDDIVGHQAGVPFTITLNKGETFSCRATNTAAFAHLGGSHIVSDKDIAVTISDDSIFSLGAWDIIGDQLVPINLIGDEYIAVKGHGANERVFIVATQDQTEVYINGSAVAATTLSQGQLYSTAIQNNSVYINTNHPVYAYHLSGHQGEMGDAVLPPITCTGSDNISFVRPGNDQFTMMLLTQSGNENNFLLNGSTLNASFSPVPGNATWLAVRIDVSTAVSPVGVNRLENTTGLFHLGILYNYDNFSSEYGYFSNYSTLNLGSDQNICEGEQLQLDGGRDMTSYTWSTGDTTRFITVTTQDTYFVSSLQYNCILRDTMVLLVNEIGVDLGDDVWTCADGDTLVYANTNNQFITYEWQDGSSDSFYFALDTGEIYVTITDTLDCEASDTIQFNYYPVIDIGRDTFFVCDSLVYIIESNLTNAQSYLWHDGSTDSFFVVTTDGYYYVDVVDQHGCFSSDTLFVAFVNSPVLDIGNDTIVCPNQLVSFDATIPAGVGYLWQDGTTTANYTTDTAGILIVRVVDTTTCFTWDTLLVENFYVPDSLFGADTLLCNDETHELIPMISNAVNYLWHDGSTDGSFYITEAGSYSVTVTDDNDCISIDEYEATYLDGVSSSSLPPDTTVCWRNPVTLNAGHPLATAYEWSGFSAYYTENDYTDSTFVARLEGTYEVAISNPCGVFIQSIEVINEDCSCEPFVPNAFSPNNDGINDKLLLFSDCEMNNVQLSIFSHKGTLIFQTNDLNAGWDGTFNGQEMPVGVYIWQLSFEAADPSGFPEQKLMAGDVTLLR